MTRRGMWWRVSGLASLAIAGWLATAGTTPAPLSAVPVLLASWPSVAGSGGTVAKIPMEHYRGWWFVRLRGPASGFKIRLTLPHELPVPVHFHVVVMPEANDQIYTGELSGGVWDRGVPSMHAFGAPGVGEMRRAVSAGVWRTAPSLLEGLPVVSEVPWKVGAPGVPAWANKNWQWREDVVSQFVHHDALAHDFIAVEFLPGSRTAWLDLMPLVPAGAEQVVVAIAPYHQPATGGADQALFMYPPVGSEALAPTHARELGDYPNDPMMLWEAYRSLPSTALSLSSVGWVRGLYAHCPVDVARFPAAWLAGAMQYPLWSTPGIEQVESAEVGVQRTHETGSPDWQGRRRAKWRMGLQGANRDIVHLSKAIVDSYYQGFKVRPMAISGIMLSLSTSFPPFEDPRFHAWYMDATGNPFDEQTAMLWFTEFSGDHPDWVATLETWFNIALDWRDHGMSVMVEDSAIWLDSTMNEIGLVTVYAIEDKRRIDNGDPSEPPLPRDHPQTTFDALYGLFSGPPVEIDAFGLAAQIGIGTGEYANDPMDFVADAFRLRRPVSWSVLTPPVFHQFEALASLEGTNLMFQWWQGMARRVYEATNSRLVGMGLQPIETRFPWKGWFPVDEASSDLWWQSYRQLPWAALSVAPRFPTISNDLGPPESQWRFYTDPPAGLDWIARLSAESSDDPGKRYWPTQPPAIRHTKEDFPQIVLPTAAYILGPIEIWIKP